MGVMTRARSRKHAPGLADMPTSIWAQFQEHMQLKEWVRAAGTCKTSWAVQYNELMIFTRYSLSVPGTAY